MYLSLFLSLCIYIHTHTHTHTQYHNLCHGSHVTAAVKTSSLAGVQMVTGVTGIHKCHMCYTSCLRQVTSAHWHMDDVNHDNMQYAMCVIRILWSFYHSWAPLHTVCLGHTGQCALLLWLLRNVLPRLTATCISESKYNIFYLFSTKNHYEELVHELFTVCVCVCVCVFNP